MTDGGDRLATFEKGEAIEVPAARIEAELAALWRAAALGRPGEAPRPVTRACLWNLIVRVQGEANFTYAKKLIDDVSATIPARAIVMRPEPGAGPTDEGGIRAWIEANWRRADGGRASGSDEVTLEATGRSVERLTSLVRALLIPDAPTAMLWVGPPPGEAAPVRGLVGDVDRLIVDTRKLPSEMGLADFDHITRAERELELVDLSWIGFSALRGLTAALFDPPHDPRPLDVLDRVRVVSGVQGTQSRALYTIGWLASRLGWEGPHRLEGSEPRRWRAARRDGGTVTVELATELGRADHGVIALEMEAGDRKWTLTRDQKCIDVRGFRCPERLQPARSHSDAELLVTALGPRGRDPVFRDALAEAARWVVAS
jgi:hypothetical protein